MCINSDMICVYYPGGEEIVIMCLEKSMIYIFRDYAAAEISFQTR